MFSHFTGVHPYHWSLSDIGEKVGGKDLSHVTGGLGVPCACFHPDSRMAVVSTDPSLM